MKYKYILTIGIIGIYSFFGITFFNNFTNLKNELERDKILVTNTMVVATVYNAKKSQTDSTPNITADGTRINCHWAGKYRYIAVSRNLLKQNGGHLNYDDYVIITGINGKYDGVWQVKDTMNKRWVNRIDLLCNLNEKPFKKDSVIVTYYHIKKGT
ncbi:hypothetical protein CL621_04995 [archaeon]|nr:hypothetical protein [archaeon]